MDVMNKLGGSDAGLPFFAVLDAKGALVVSSKKDGRDNIGYPLEAEEIGWFMTMLNKGAPQMTTAERQVIEGWLSAQKR